MNVERILNLNEQSEKPVWLVRGSNKVFYVQKTIDSSLYPLYAELQRISRREHAGIPQIIDITEDKEHLIVLEEWINGRTIADILSEKHFSSDEVLTIMLRLCEILNGLHRHTPKIIHRDLKPSNIIMTEEGEIVLLDFDASRFYSPGEVKDTTQLGTAGYAPPEQYGFGQCDERSDIYALGVFMNVMLTGEHPKDKKAGLPFSTVIQKCTEMDMERRFQSVEGLKAVLLGFRNIFPEKEKDHQAKTAKSGITSWLLPGFRSGKPWKMVVAGLFYLLIIVLSFALKDSQAGVIVSFSVGMTALWMVLLLFDYRGICDRLPFLRAHNFGLRLIGIIFWTFCFFCVILVTLIGLDSLLNKL